MWDLRDQEKGSQGKDTSRAGVWHGMDIDGLVSEIVLLRLVLGSSEAVGSQLNAGGLL